MGLTSATSGAGIDICCGHFWTWSNLENIFSAFARSKIIFHFCPKIIIFTYVKIGFECMLVNGKIESVKRRMEDSIYKIQHFVCLCKDFSMCDLNAVQV